MYYLKFGNSRKLIAFLHGWGSSHDVFLWLKDYFIDDYSLLFLDFTGFGKSEMPKFPYSVSDYVNELKCLIDGFDFDELIFVTHSFGGRVALKFLFYYQLLYKKVSLCLIDSAGILPKRGLVYKFKILKYKHLKRKADKNPRLLNQLNRYGSADYKGLNDVMKQTFIKVVNEDLKNYAKYLNCKTIIVWGRKDKETKLYMAKKLHKLIKNSKLYIFDDAGHFSFIEKKEDFIIILDSFLKNL